MVLWKRNHTAFHPDICGVFAVAEMSLMAVSAISLHLSIAVRSSDRRAIYGTRRMA
jgi:hypothetical protein